MLDQDLFIQKMLFEKTADDKILGDSNSWEQEITKSLYEQAPYIGKYNMVLNFTKRDDERGYAFGQIVVNNSITIPFIISSKNGKSVLNSMDMFNYEGKWLPLTNDRVESILFNHQAFDRLATPEEEAVGTGRQIGVLDQPPDSGREILASASDADLQYRLADTISANQPPEPMLKSASKAILDVILPSASRDDIKHVLDTIDADEKLAATYEMNNHFGTIRKIASESLKVQDEDKIINEQLPVNIIEIEKTGSDYKLTVTSDSLYRPVVKQLDVVTMRKMGGDTLVKKASDEGHVIFEVDRKDSNVFIVEDVNCGLTNIEKTGSHNVAGIDGEVYDTVDFNLSATGKKLFTNGEKFAYQTRLVGKQLEKDAYDADKALEENKKRISLATNEAITKSDSNFDDIARKASGKMKAVPHPALKVKVGSEEKDASKLVEELERKMLSADASVDKLKKATDAYKNKKFGPFMKTKKASLGDWVSFVISPSWEHGIASEPVKLASVAVAGKNGIKIAAERADGRRITLILSPDVVTFVEKDGEYYIPAYDPIVLGERIEVETDIRKLDHQEKIASRTENTVEVIWSGSEYVLRGTDDCRRLNTEYGVNKYAARSALVKLGATVKEADLILKRAQLSRKINVSGLNNLITERMIKKASDINKVALLKQDTIKLAAMMPTEDSVDKVLSLNFINPLNLRQFIDFIPTFEETVSNLCALLLATRLGLKELDEYALKTAIQVLEKIITDLKNMFTVVDTLNSISGDM